MSLSKALTLIVLFFIIFMAFSCSNRKSQDFEMFASIGSSFVEGQGVPVGELFKMKLGKTFIWVSKRSGPYLPHLKPSSNTCSRIPFELTSVHDDSVALAEVIICNVDGKIVYFVPINS